MEVCTTNLKPEHIAHNIISWAIKIVWKNHTILWHWIFHSKEIQNQTGLFKGKRISVISTGIGPDNIDIVINELDGQYRFRNPQTKETLH
jgi:uridine phosphorylase